MTDEMKAQIRSAGVELVKQGGGIVIAVIVIWFLFQSLLPGYQEQIKLLIGQVSAAEKAFLEKIQLIEDKRELSARLFSEDLKKLIPADEWKKLNESREEIRAEMKSLLDDIYRDNQSILEKLDEIQDSQNQ